ncbi:hypothetical protein KAK06_20870 [Ideonella sp. 4Y11]|uniref:Uncharacterized protein n=1 Tax=Ideonella aquatica TaxID=2824119 RepID=A0A941BLG8_9BURK|nr:hypothetical protein [Ideonella aquatica]MBQ0961422.1 hypothetical protein [Ideonella aquatica]
MTPAAEQLASIAQLDAGTDLGCDARLPRCHATNSLVARDEISSPCMVVQQAFDFVVHGDLLRDPHWLSERGWTSMAIPVRATLGWAAPVSAA